MIDTSTGQAIPVAFQQPAHLVPCRVVTVESELACGACGVDELRRRQRGRRLVTLAAEQDVPRRFHRLHGMLVVAEVTEGDLDKLRRRRCLEVELDASAEERRRAVTLTIVR